MITRRLHNVSPHKMERFVYKNTFYTCNLMLFLIAHHLLCLIRVRPSFETLHFRFFNHCESHQTDLSVVHLPFIHFALLSLQSFSYKHSNKTISNYLCMYFIRWCVVRYYLTFSSFSFHSCCICTRRKHV